MARFGRQSDLKGIVAPSPDADRTIRYLTKYLTKAMVDTHVDEGRGRRTGTVRSCWSARTPDSAGAKPRDSREPMSTCCGRASA